MTSTNCHPRRKVIVNKTIVAALLHYASGLANVENIRIIPKGQIIGSNNSVPTFENFKTLAVS